MSQEIVGFYLSRKKRLMKDFDRTLGLMKPVFAGRYGEGRTEAMLASIRKEFEQIIPEIPSMDGFRERRFYGMLLITAQELAAYRVLHKEGLRIVEIWELCHEALRRRLALIPSWKRRIIGFLWHSILGPVTRRRARRKKAGSIGGFRMKYLGQKQDFGFGVDYTGCGHRNFLERQGSGEFARFVCLSDIALSRAFGWGLTRTETLAEGYGRCDFRFTKGGPTRISSEDPAVREAIGRSMEESLPEA